MAESSDVGAASVPIPLEQQLRADNAVPVPLMYDTRPASPSSILSYNRRLSRASQDELEKLGEIQRRGTEDDDS
jgi:hypothetical protein